MFVNIPDYKLQESRTFIFLNALHVAGKPTTAGDLLAKNRSHATFIHSI